MKIFSSSSMIIAVSLILILFGVFRVYSTIISPKYSPSGDAEQHEIVDRKRLILMPIDIASITLGALLLLKRKQLIAKITFWFSVVMMFFVGRSLLFYLFFLLFSPGYLFFEGAAGFYNMIDTLVATIGLMLVIIILKRYPITNIQ